MTTPTPSPRRERKSMTREQLLIAMEEARPYVDFGSPRQYVKEVWKRLNIEAEAAPAGGLRALERAANEGRNVLPDATDDQASVIEQWALAALAASPSAWALDVEHGERWPEGVSDGLSLPCADCGLVPRFDYHVSEAFWRQWVPDKPDRLGVVCLPCLDRRCGGVGLAAAIEQIQWTGTGHTIVLLPDRRYEYAAYSEEGVG